jgi:Cyanobacterial TRADD-N associated 2-Transmembrane domain
MSVSESSQETIEAHHKACDELGHAINQGKLGDIVAKHEKLILQYYRDVQQQARKSFDTARFAATFGFIVLICTLAYALAIDGWTRLSKTPQDTKNLMTVAVLGVVSGTLIEFIAGVAFWLYARGARQFAAFHICLERTHRYLLAYKITEQIAENKDGTLHDLVCMMASAPMITREDIESDFRSDITKATPPSGARVSGATPKP